ncbi:MAG: regulatory protein RecX [Pseudomonadota bacterium]|nr:regulatory protein RecX [Pseudomonadota bacterium]
MTPRSKAMDFLARREYGFEELYLRLSKYFDKNDVRDVVSALRDEGLQSDNRFAEALTQRRFNQGYGPNYVCRELLAKKIDSEIVENVISKHNWRENISNVVNKHTCKTAQQLQRYLLYKGYDFEMINQVVKT